MMKKAKISHEEERILNQVPPDYYQKGVKNNIFQRLWHFGKLKTVLSLIDGYPQTVLDIGCASGWFLSQISKKYPEANCVGIDKYKRAIEYGRKRYKSIKLLHADSHKLPFKSNSFDLVICTEVLEHVSDPREALREIKRVLKKNGIAIVEMDSGNFLFRLAWYWWTNIRKGVWKDSHLHLFNVDKLTKMLKSENFVISKKRIFNYTMGIAFLLKNNK